MIPHQIDSALPLWFYQFFSTVVFFFILLATEIISLTFCVWAIRRLYRYIDRYRFSESQYSLLFQFVHLRYFIWTYVLSVCFTTIVGLVFAFTLLTQTPNV